MNFVAIDFETANYGQESACAIGLVKFIDGRAADSFYSLIRPPELYIRPNFTAIHGLTVDDVKNAPQFKDLWEPKIQPFIGTFPLAAHNARFDMPVLCAALNWFGLAVPPLKYFCTLELSRRCWPEFRSHALSRLAQHFDIVYDAHNALADAETCGAIALLAAQKYRVSKLDLLLTAAKLCLKSLNR